MCTIAHEPSERKPLETEKKAAREGRKIEGKKERGSFQCEKT